MLCRKCKNQARVVLRTKDAYCKECFLAASTHKFRATLGKTKIMKVKDRALVAFSGSQSSVALLHFLRSGLDEEQHKKLFFDVVVCYIEGKNSQNHFFLINENTILRFFFQRVRFLMKQKLKGPYSLKGLNNR